MRTSGCRRIVHDHPNVRFRTVRRDSRTRSRCPSGGETPSRQDLSLHDQDQQFLLRPSIRDWLPEEHLARFASELVDEVLDLDPSLSAYRDVRGYPPYDRRLMIKLVPYGYLSGVRSSRKIEKACHDSGAFRFLSANAAPEFCSIARFRRRQVEETCLDVYDLETAIKSSLMSLAFDLLESPR